MKDGKRWRWLGAPLADAVEYFDATRDSAEGFDKIMETACFGDSESMLSTSPVVNR
jgi:hypothetical protein